EHLPPTRDMVQHFASIICGFEVGKTWVTRFVQRHHKALTPQWTSAMASERHAADSYSKYSLYFDMLELKISKKGSFFLLFWPAWLQLFTKDNILKAFKATGLQPLNRDKVLKRFPKGAATPSTPPPPKAGTTARKIIRKLDSVVGNRYSNKARALCHEVHHLTIKNELLNNNVQGLTELLLIKKKQDKKSKALTLVKPLLDYWGGAKWWLPQLFKEARHREQIIKETAHAEKLEKANVKELKAANKLYNDKIKEQKREAAAAAKEVRDRKCAEERVAIDARKAQRLKDKQARDAQKASQLPNKGKRKASKAPQAPAAKKRRSAQPRSGAVAAAAAPPRGTHTTRSGRTATLYK
ncbi:uncharacterized protein M421DRAFT_424288, partial [Didymella exigua CBS 183.55]